MKRILLVALVAACTNRPQTHVPPPIAVEPIADLEETSCGTAKEAISEPPPKAFPIGLGTCADTAEGPARLAVHR
jgi:hypothetical protein